MPSWNVHTAHVERLLAERSPETLGIGDANAFLFGNYVPDLYLGFMVADTTYRIDYLLTHLAKPSIIPIPDADLFWDRYVCRHVPDADAGRSLVLGAWAHLVTDRYYNGRFRTFAATHDTPKGDELRERKQADFDLFGHSLGITSYVRDTPDLKTAAQGFWPYRILPDDVDRAIAVACAIVDDCATAPSGKDYQLLDESWFNDTFEACNERLAVWLEAWQRLQARGARAKAVDIRAEAGLPAALPDEGFTTGQVR